MVSHRLSSYFGPSPQTPTTYLHAPNYPSYPAPPRTSPSASSPQPTNGITPPPKSLNILLLSTTDGRDTLVDLTRTLAEMSQSHKLNPQDITQDLIDTELSATTSIPASYTTRSTSSSHNLAEQTPPIESTSASPSEPDLLLIFGPYVKLDGYPPWQVRLTEIFCVGDAAAGRSDGGVRVEYQGFLRGLWKFAGAEMRFGR